MTGNAPWKITLSDGQQFTTNQSNFAFAVKPSSTTTYTLQSVNNVCGEGSVSGSAIAKVYAEGELENLVLLRPNPTSDVSVLEVSKALSKHAKEVQIYDFLGKNIYTWNQTYIPYYDLQLEINKLQIGTYFVKVITTKGIFYRKLVKV
jgi:acid phosphatase type 7